MSTFLREELGVAMSGVKWDVASYKLWQSTRPEIILFTPKQPVLAKGSNGRYQCAVSQHRQQSEGTYKITGGSSIFTVTSAIQHDPREFEELKQQWVSEMNAQGPAPARNPRFIPLNVQKGTAQVLINEVSGVPNEAHNEANIGTPGGTNSFLVELTALGAQEWVQGIKEKQGIPAGVKMMYEYLRMMPDVGAEVIVKGRRAFQHFSSELDVSVDGFWYGGSAKIEAAWEKMVREGAVEINFIGQLPPELEEIRQDLVSTFADQARTQLFNSLFEPKPNVEPAEAGDTGGIFGGANFALKYRREEEITDLRQTIRFQGWTWMKASMDADLVSLFHELDETYVNEVNTEMSFPASIVVDADPMLENVAVSWSPSEGKAPEAPTYGSEGGNNTYTITSDEPDAVEVRHTAKVNFTPPTWPVIETSGSSRIRDGGNQVVIKPSSWVGRHMIFMFVQEGEEIKMTDIENDYLIANVSYEGPHLPRPIRSSARITPFEPIEFSYPLSPSGERGQAKFSAFGVIGGRLVRSAEQNINFDEEAVFILARRDGLELVSQASITAENSLADRLRRGNARAMVSGEAAPSSNVVAEVYHRPHMGPAVPEHINPSAGPYVSGTVVAVEYSAGGPALVLEKPSGERVRIPMRHWDLADRLDDERKRVRVALDQDAYAAAVTVEL